MRRRKDSGFSLLEVTFVGAITVVLGSVALIQLRATRTVFEAQSVANMVVSQINYARQVAIDQRRNVLIQFLATNEIKVSRLESGGGTTVLSDVYLPSGFQYGLPSGTPPDTPENFGNATPVSFNSATGGAFLGDGTLVDTAGVVLNGTVFTIGSGDSTAKAVTLTGATGRVLQYSYTGGIWKQNK
jgi:Tfp pilus assembly protein FimT